MEEIFNGIIIAIGTVIAAVISKYLGTVRANKDDRKEDKENQNS